MIFPCVIRDCTFNDCFYFKEKLKKLGMEFDSMKNDLSDKILSLTRKLESLEEFRLQKEDLESQHKLLQETLTNERKEHQEKVYN